MRLFLNGVGANSTSPKSAFCKTFGIVQDFYYGDVMKQHLCLAVAFFIIQINSFASQEIPPLYHNALIAAESALHNQSIPVVSNELEYIKTLSVQPGIEDSFHTVNICSLVDRMSFWNEHLPKVAVHYALKTNHDQVISSVLANLGAGFDCASAGEMRQVLQLGVSPENIIFSHPRKPASEIEFAEKNGVKLMVFDSIEELNKMMRYAPSGAFLLRIKTHDEHSETPLSTKFGASMQNAYKILDYAYKNKASVVGISFHVGSNNRDKTAFTQAIMDASLLFKYSEKQWKHPLTLLDLGGGWPGDNDERFIQFADTVNQDLTRYFPEKVRVIAEPGRYFATQTTTAAIRVIGTEELETPKGSKFAYYLADGVYGLFSASLYYHYDAKSIAMEGWAFHPLRPSKDHTSYPSIFWGPTCDSGDKILDNIFFPKMHINEFIYSKNVGSYTYSGQTAFNQITPSKSYYLCQFTG